MGMHNQHLHQDTHEDRAGVNDYGEEVRPFTRRIMDSPSPSLSPEALGYVTETGLVSDWIEVWDYVGGIRFRGFVAQNEGEKAEKAEKAMCIFFDQNVIGGDLKAGLMALLELCEVAYFSCTRLVACIDRHTDRRAMDTLTKDLGWIGFQLSTLEDFTGEGVISNEWLFMDMET